MSTPEGSPNEQPPVRFTAVNGQGSPSAGESGADGRGAPLEQSSVQEKADVLSGSGNHKRKLPSSGQHSPNSVTSHHSGQQKKPRLTPPTDGIPTTPHEPVAALQHDHDPSRQYSDKHAWSAHQHLHNTDAHLAEALQREAQLDPAGPGSSTGSPEPRYQGTVSSDGTPGRSGSQGARMDSSTPIGPPLLQKQRKRNFSNRTKTGCMTCRERKKKCDEGKPVCNNCERGGFHCKGYTQLNPLYKPSMREQPPLQAKNGFYHEVHQSGPFYNCAPPPPPDYYEPAPQHLPQMSAQQHRPSLESSRGRPSVDETEHLRQLSNASGHERGPPPPTYGRAAPPQWDQLPHEQYTPRPDGNSRGQSYSKVSSINDMSRHRELPPPASMHMQAQPAPQAQPSGRTSSQASLPVQQFQDSRMTAQLALEASHATASSSRNNPPPSSTTAYHIELRTEKEKMLAGVPFNTRDLQLSSERRECAVAVHRFNKNAIDPTNLSEAARREQFRQIVEPHTKAGDRDLTNGVEAAAAAADANRPIGALGANVEVEAPFYCEYGYNIRIGAEVEIGANCRIMDACAVSIGDRTIIGPDVKILAIDGDHVASRKPGQKRLLRGKKVVIGEDVFIGAGAIVLPGTVIEAGATVGAGSVVNKNVVGPVTFVNHLRPRVLRSHWNTGAPPY